MTFIGFTRGESAARWRRSAAEFARLHACRDLPVLTWTVGQAGAAVANEDGG